jgi:radical SAM protein with 4Fe4S-binding SPASM domain
MYEASANFHYSFQARTNHVSKILDKIKLPDSPSVFTLELTSACNHHCTGCGNIFPHNANHLSYAAWKEIITKIKKYAFSLRLTGGECTLHPEFNLILREIDKLKIPYVIFTNGDWMSPDEMLNLFKSCQHCDGLLISLHGYDTESYYSFVKTEAFDRVVANIEKSVKAGLKVALNTVLNKYNYQKIEKIVKLGKSLGVFSIAFSRYCGQNSSQFELSVKEFQVAFEQIIQLNKKDKSIVFNNCVPACFIIEDYPTKACTSGITHCTVGPDGFVRPCTHSPLKLGKINERSLDEIWRSDVLKYWHSLIPEFCLNCSLFNQCRGGCRANAYHKNLEQDPFINFPQVKKTKGNEVQTLKIKRDARISVNYRLKTQDFGYYLINRNRHIPVKKEAAPILSFLNQKPLVKDIEVKFGKQALDFVGSLIVAGLVLTD